jgi:hypothetical protein
MFIFISSWRKQAHKKWQTARWGWDEKFIAFKTLRIVAGTKKNLRWNSFYIWIFLQISCFNTQSRNNSVLWHIPTYSRDFFLLNSNQIKN